ncbi:hypothetical protein GCM10020221_14140 [Streptomyces thioluteus]|uniref:TFIIB-type zinc ribbon-containing protein n=1 Tax=Streptomyces thioluteus TaxID=66431 RepID=A0ABN3WJU9_STRTU
MNPPARFHDPGHSRDHFTDTILVRCPRCPAAARVADSKLVCPGCGLSRYARESSPVFRYGPPTDPYFQLPLHLQTETRHGRLWAYNPEHLMLIRQFVAAPLRERAPWYEPGRKMTLLARLPAWVKRSKNRAEVLRAIDRMRAELLHLNGSAGSTRRNQG